MPDSKVEWYAGDVLLVVDEATDDLLTRLAFQGEGYAKTNAPSASPGFDTGFMRNAIYGLGPNDDHRSEAASKAQGVADRALARKPSLKKHEAAIHAAALYTIYWEEEFDFMYRALEQLKKIAGGVIREVGKEHFDD